MTRVGSLVACAPAAFLIAPFAVAQPSALAAKFKAAAQTAIAEWEAKSGAEGHEVLERFRRY
jgi:hypothetical protein